MDDGGSSSIDGNYRIGILKPQASGRANASILGPKPPFLKRPRF